MLTYLGGFHEYFRYVEKKKKKKKKKKKLATLRFKNDNPVQESVFGEGEIAPEVPTAEAVQPAEEAKYKLCIACELHRVVTFTCGDTITYECEACGSHYDVESYAREFALYRERELRKLHSPPDPDGPPVPVIGSWRHYRQAHGRVLPSISSYPSVGPYRPYVKNAGLLPNALVTQHDQIVAQYEVYQRFKHELASITMSYRSGEVSRDEYREKLAELQKQFETLGPEVLNKAIQENDPTTKEGQDGPAFDDALSVLL